MNQILRKKGFPCGTASCLLVLFLLIGTMGCKKEMAPDSTSSGETMLSINKKKLTLSSSSSYDASLSLPSGYVTDGSKDYTSYLQTAINNHSNITFPGFPILINANGLKIGSNKTITFLSGSQLIMQPNNYSNYSVLTVLSADNVTLNNPVVIGDRYNHIDTTGQWGQGISVRGSSNVTINNASVSNCWGDGIYLAAINGVGNSNVTIISPYCVYNRRNGISVTNVIGLDLESPFAAYSNGSPPYTGIDIEAESYNDELQNITVNNPSTAYNLGNGISMGFRSLLGGNDKTISITINNHSDKGSATALRATCTLTKRAGTEVVSGKININNPFWRRNNNTPIATDLLLNTIRLSINNPVVQDVNGNNLSDSSIVSLFTYKTNINSGANYSINFF